MADAPSIDQSLAFRYGPSNYTEAQYIREHFAKCAQRALVATDIQELLHYTAQVVQCTQWLPACAVWVRDEMRRQLSAPLAPELSKAITESIPKEWRP